jgi:fermentation-respiration switch protein FrsA (DUF1100 family)
MQRVTRFLFALTLLTPTFGTAFAARVGGSGEPSVPGFAEHGQWVFGTRTHDETLAVTRQMTLEKAAANITCPFLIVHGENDRQIPLWHAEKLYEAAVNSPDRELKVFQLATAAPSTAAPTTTR